MKITIDEAYKLCHLLRRRCGLKHIEIPKYPAVAGHLLRRRCGLKHHVGGARVPGRLSSSAKEMWIEASLIDSGSKNKPSSSAKEMWIEAQMGMENI